MTSKSLQIIMLVSVLIVATCLPGYARHRHDHVWIVGPRWVDPYPYTYPYRYYYPAPQPLVIREYPEVYIQQQSPAPPSAPEQTYWYYCPSPQGYYPYIKDCPSGWMKVVPPAPPNGAQQPQKQGQQP